MGCFGGCVPAPASQQERKTYNFLVPDVFPAAPPAADAPVPHAIMKKVSKLQEYCERNPGKIAKVSRRLTRRIKLALTDGNLGYARIGVAAYVFLLDNSSSSKDKSYSLNYFTKELIQPPDAVINTLLVEPRPEVRALGAELLSAFIRAQSEVENQAAAVKPLVKTLCATLVAPDKPGGGGGIVANGVVGGGGAGAAVRVAGMAAIREYVLFHVRTKTMPELVEEVAEAILSNVDLTSVECRTMVTEVTAPGLARALSRVSSGAVGGATGTTGGATGGTGSATAAAAGPKSAADHSLLALRSFKPFLQDVSIVYRVLDALLKHLDRTGKWENAQFVDGLMCLVKHGCGEQTYPFFASLMRHAGVAGLTPEQRRIVIEQAVTKGMTTYSLSAVSLALKELPKALEAAGATDPDMGAADESADRLSFASMDRSTVDADGASGPASATPQGALRAAVLAAVRQLSAEVGDAGELCEALAGSLRAFTTPPAGATPDAEFWSRPLLRGALSCVVSSLECMPRFVPAQRAFPTKVFPAGLLQQLGAVLVAQAYTSEPSPEAHRARTSALAALRCVLSAAGAGGVHDERAASGALLTALAIAIRPGATPRELEVASALSAAAVAGGRPAALLTAARVAVAVRAHALGPSVRQDVSDCALLLLADVIVGQLGQASGCAAQSIKGLVVPKGRVQTGAAVVMQQSSDLHPELPVMLALSGSFPSDDVGGAAASAINAARALEGGQAAWAAELRKALGGEGILADEYGASGTSAHLSAPLDLSTPAAFDAMFQAVFKSTGRFTVGAPAAAADATRGASLDRAADGSVRAAGDALGGAPGPSASSIMATHANALSAKVEATWTMRRTSLRHDKVNLEAVLMMLDEAPDRQASAGDTDPLQLSPSSSPVQVSIVPPDASVSIREALSMTAPFERMVHGAASGIDISKLALQFDPIAA
ncbi:hypothetical protein FOA52_009747 [Chlamydomonas sp. UWO 241]|nr:hypothetical protein FOA52_009747 [Chlamydomonas sp. UWO 241]